MPEAILLMLDNSEYSINGDYWPTRWMNQIDAASLLINNKMEHDGETAIGIGLMGGKQIEIVCPPSKNQIQVSSFLYGVKQFGTIKLIQALQISILALKHRVDINLKQKIICFISSTVDDNIQDLKLISKKLKKNNIAVNLVCFGDLSQKQKQKLNAIFEIVNHENNSSIVFVEQGHNLSQVLLLNKYQELNPNMVNEDDPQLMMALQLSLQDNSNNLQQQARINEEQLEQRAFQLSLEEDKDNKSEKKDQ